MHCMVCGLPCAPSHVVVYGSDGHPAGEVCGYHQLREILLDPGDRFQLGLMLVPEGERTPSASAS